MNALLEELPEGWTVATIEELCELNPKHVSSISDHLLVSFVPMAAVSEVDGRIVKFDPRSFGEVKRGYTHFADGDVLFAKITPCMENGKAASVRGMVNGLACGTTEFFVFRPRGAIDQDYLFYFIRQESYRKAARSHMQSGVGQARVPKSFVLGTGIPLPPLAEQRRIVARIKALQVHSRKAREALEAILPLLDQFRQSVLAAAFRGDLTAEWREQHPNPEPASMLLAAIRQERRRTWEEAKPGKKYVEPDPADPSDLPDLPEGWSWAALRELVAYFDSQRVPVRDADRNTRKGPYPYYGAFGIIDGIDDYLFEGGFLLVAEDGKNLLSRTKPIAFQAHGQFWVNNHAHVLQTRGSIPLAYLECYLNAFDLTQYVTGIDQVKLNRESMDTIPVPLAPLKEQEEIARMVAARLAAAENVRTHVAHVLDDCHNFDQSMLAKAFRGELVPQDSDDEPASVLLERLRAANDGEHCNGTPKRRRRRAGA